MISLITFVAGMRSQERSAEEGDELCCYDNRIELNPITDVSSKLHPKIPGYKQMKQGVLVDSGAGASVADGDDFPGCVRESSEGSRRGQKFMGPGTEVLMNRGQITVPIVTREAIASKLKFQDAQVRRPILAVKDSCKAGNLVLFDEDLSAIIPRQSREGQQIRALAKQAAIKITLDEVDGVYVMPAWTNQPPSDIPESPFQRRGAKA